MCGHEDDDTEDLDNKLKACYKAYCEDTNLQMGTDEWSKLDRKEKVASFIQAVELRLEDKDVVDENGEVVVEEEPQRNDGGQNGN